METLAPPRRRQSAQWHHPQKRDLFCLVKCFFEQKIPIPTSGAHEASPISLEVVSRNPYEMYVVKVSSLFKKFSPSFKSTLQIEGTLQA